MTKLKRIVFCAYLCLISTIVIAQENAERTVLFNIDDALAIQGYDPVAYFKEGKAKEGNAKITAKYKGIIYYFKSIENKELFEHNPQKYEPQYGGWCAYAMGKDGSKVKVDPETFKIIDGKLYLFYNFFFNNTLKSWNDNENSLKQQADINWDALLSNN